MCLSYHLLPDSVCVSKKVESVQSQDLNPGTRIRCGYLKVHFNWCPSGSPLQFVFFFLIISLISCVFLMFFLFELSDILTVDLVDASSVFTLMVLSCSYL